MSSQSLFYPQDSRRGFFPRFGGLLLVSTLLSAAFPSALLAQVALPSAAPTATIAPQPSPAPEATPVPTPVPVDPPPASPAPTPGDDGQVTITQGVPDAGAQASYRAARTPQASITLSATVPTSPTSPSLTGASATTATTARARTKTLAASGGVFNTINLSTLSQAQSMKTNATTASAASTSPVATVVLAYDASCAGQVVSVQPLNGGTLSAIGGDGKTVTAPADGFLLAIATDGTASFSYQPPAASGTYQVLTRLDNVMTTLPFLVPDPQ